MSNSFAVVRDTSQVLRPYLVQPGSVYLDQPPVLGSLWANSCGSVEFIAANIYGLVSCRRLPDLQKIRHVVYMQQILC